MASSVSSKHIPSYNVQTISFPARSHPRILRLQEELIKLDSCETSSSSITKTICTSISGLTLKYTCIDDLFNLPTTQQSLFQHQDGKLVNNILDGLLRYLDICNTTRDFVLPMKEAIRELQSSLRRSKACGDQLKLSIQRYIDAYFFSRKNLKKQLISKSFASLQKMDEIVKESPMLIDENHHLSAVIKVVQEASLVTISVLGSLLSFLSMPIFKPKRTSHSTKKWSLVSKLVHKRVVACEGQEFGHLNEMEHVDFALTKLLVNNLSKELEIQRIDVAQARLEDLDTSIEAIEIELDCLFKALIHARFSLLNILSR